MSTTKCIPSHFPSLQKLSTYLLSLVGLFWTFQNVLEVLDLLCV
jgi:hypothetical protein